MQVQIETEPKEWQPKTLSVTFETEDEYVMFLEMLSWDSSIPKLAYEDSITNRARLSQLMQDIQRGINKGN